MSITEYERHQILSWFEQHMGSELAPAMMNLLPPVGWGDMATKRDLDNLRTEFIGKFDRIDGRFEQVDARFEQVDARFDQVDARFDQVDARFDQVDARFDQVEAKIDSEVGNVRGEIGGLRGEVHREIGKLRRDMYVVVLSAFAAATAILSTVIGVS